MNIKNTLSRLSKKDLMKIIQKSGINVESSIRNVIQENNEIFEKKMKKSTDIITKMDVSSIDKMMKKMRAANKLLKQNEKQQIQIHNEIMDLEITPTFSLVKSMNGVLNDYEAIIPKGSSYSRDIHLLLSAVKNKIEIILDNELIKKHGIKFAISMKIELIKEEITHNVFSKNESKNVIIPLNTFLTTSNQSVLNNKDIRKSIRIAYSQLGEKLNRHTQTHSNLTLNRIFHFSKHCRV